MEEKKKRTANSGSITAERAKEMQRRSAQAKSENALARKSAREFAIAAMNAEVTDKGSGKKIVVKDAVVQRLVAKAIQESDLNAIKYLFELIGESPAQKLEVTGKDGESLFNEKPMSRKEAAEMLRRFEQEL